MDYDFTPLLSRYDNYLIQQHKKKMDRINRQTALEQYYQDVLNNKDLFDREYYIAHLEKKGFKFDDAIRYTSELDMELKVAEQEED